VRYIKTEFLYSVRILLNPKNNTIKVVDKNVKYNCVQTLLTTKLFEDICCLILMILIQPHHTFPDCTNEAVGSTVFFFKLTQVDIMLGFNSQEGLMVTSLFKGRMSIPLKIRISTFFTLSFDFILTEEIDVLLFYFFNKKKLYFLKILLVALFLNLELILLAEI
jgi:hypothetical protein